MHDTTLYVSMHRRCSCSVSQISVALYYLLYLLAIIYSQYSKYPTVRLILAQ